jgi:hypothetical protein
MLNIQQDQINNSTYFYELLVMDILITKRVLTTSYKFLHFYYYETSMNRDIHQKGMKI